MKKESYGAAVDSVHHLYDAVFVCVSAESDEEIDVFVVVAVVVVGVALADDVSVVAE